MCLAANSRQACGDDLQLAERQAARKSSFSAPTGSAPITSCADRGHRKSRDRQTARQRFQHHQSKCVGPARKHEHVGRGIGLRQFLALARAKKHRLRIFPGQRRPRRSVADDQLGAGQIELQERLKILFDRDPADADKNRARQAEVHVARMKQFCIDAARPQHHVAKTAQPQFGGKRGRRRHHRLARAVEPAQRRPDPGFRDRQPRRNIFGKAGVEARRERQAMPPAIAPHQQADRPFGCDVKMLSSRACFDQASCSRRARPSQHRQIGIARHREGGAERSPVRGEETDLGASNAVAASAIIVSVRTTPLSWGCHASVATRIRIRPRARSRRPPAPPAAADRSR